MSELICRFCGGNLHLGYKSVICKNSQSELIGIANLPVLLCSRCNQVYILDKIKHIVKNLDILDDIVDVVFVNSIEQRKECTWYDFEKLKKYIYKDFIVGKVVFLYDKADYYFLPGLERGWNIGFLTPVFFKMEVLLKYFHHQDFIVDISANTMGYIFKNDEHMISFGINENNKVIMWLGDILDLPEEEQYYLRSENIPSDHSIESDFYESQIEVQWSKPSSEKELLNKRLEFNKIISKKFNVSITQLDIETLIIAKSIQKLLFKSESEFKVLINSLNQLFIETINTKEIRKNLLSSYPELAVKLENKKGLKCLQLWLEQNLNGINVEKEIAPLFVLYDMRIWASHLLSETGSEDYLKNCCVRIGLDENEKDYILIVNTLMEKMIEMYTNFINSLIDK